MSGVRIGNAAHALLAEASRSVWLVRPEFWHPFSRLLALDELVVTPPAAPEAASRRRSGGGDTRSRSAVAVIPLQGLIMPKPNILSMLFGGGGGLAAFRESLRTAVADDDVDAIVLDVDSPGGSSALIEEAAADIRAAREVKPIVAVANTDAGSAAYWLAAQANEVAITPSGMVGSVGAYILHVSYAGMNEQMGVEPTFISAGRYKVEANAEEPLTDEATEHLQAIVDETHATFVRDVAAGRGVPERVVRRGYGEGRMLTAQSALAAGMVDRIETLEQTVARLLAGDAPGDARRAQIPSEGDRSVSDDEARHEAGSGKSPSQVARNEDHALIDSIIATH